MRGESGQQLQRERGITPDTNIGIYENKPNGWKASKAKDGVGIQNQIRKIGAKNIESHSNE